ncbi:MAG: hypothetical protein ABIT01_16030 [Thermoanaerobaculia bacterium]
MAARKPSNDVSVLDKAIELLALGVTRIPDGDDLRERTALIVFFAGVASLGALWKRKMSADLSERLARHEVFTPWGPLYHALLAIARDPSPSAVDACGNAYIKTVSAKDYKLGLVRGLQLQQLLTAAASAHGGDILKGALHLFF